MRYGSTLRPRKRTHPERSLHHCGHGAQPISVQDDASWFLVVPSATHTHTHSPDPARGWLYGRQCRRMPPSSFSQGTKGKVDKDEITRDLRSSKKIVSHECTNAYARPSHSHPSEASRGLSAERAEQKPRMPRMTGRAYEEPVRLCSRVGACHKCIRAMASAYGVGSEGTPTLSLGLAGCKTSHIR